MKTPGLLSLVIVTVVLAIRFAIQHTTGRTIADYLIEAFEALVKFGVATAQAMRAAQREFRSTWASLKEAAA